MAPVSSTARKRYWRCVNYDTQSSLSVLANSETFPYPKIIMKQIQALWVLFFTCMLYAGTIIWAYLGSHYSFDFFYFLRLYSTNVNSWPQLFSSITAPDYTGCCHPLLGLVMCIAHFLFGLDQGSYMALNLAVHCANSFLLFFLCRQFFIPSRLSLICSALFLTSSIAWPTRFEVYNGFFRHLSLFYFLLGILAFIHTVNKGKGQISLGALAFFSAGLLTYHDGVTLPLVLLTIALFLPYSKDLPSLRRSTIGTGAIGLIISVGYLYYVQQAEVMYFTPAFSYGWHSLKKLIIIPREALAHFFIPRPHFGLSDIPGFRMIPIALFLTAFFFLAIRYRNTHNKTLFSKYSPMLFFAIAWVPITALPYLSNRTSSSEWDWYLRYLYFPSVGICIIAGIVLDIFFSFLSLALKHRPTRALTITGIVGYLCVFGTVSTILRGQESRFRRESSKQYLTGQKEAELIYGLWCKISSLDLRPQDHFLLIMHGAPLSPERLRVIFDNPLERTGSHVVIVTTAKPLKPLVGPCYSISFSNGTWGKLTRSSL